MSTPAAICIRMQDKPTADYAEFSLVAWRAEGEELARRKKELIVGTWQLQFDIGDWLIKCENYMVGEEITGYSKSTLRTFVYVARHVPFLLRIANLPWGIHQLVAPFKSDGDKEAFLDLAVKQKWSVSNARTYLAKAQAEGLFKSCVVPKSGSDFQVQNNEDFCHRNREHLETTQDEIDIKISVYRLRRCLEGMRRWKVPVVDDSDLSRALPLLPLDQKARAIRCLRRAASELTTMAERLESFTPVTGGQ